MVSYPVGTLPPVGEVPDEMTAQVIRQERMGDSATAFQPETVATPSPQPGEVLIAVMAAGINFNNVWAARGVPVDVVAARQRQGASEDFHIGGSDASGIIYAVGEGVEDVQVGQEVIVHPGWWAPTEAAAGRGDDPMLSPSAAIWGYDCPRNYGAFAQFAIAQAHQVLPKASHLTWEEAAASTLVGATAYRMMYGWAGHELKEGDLVLVWGGSGGVGGQAIQLATHAGARAIAVVSDAARGEYCETLGAIGYIDRTDFEHWGQPPHWTEASDQKTWLGAVRAFGKRIWEIAGERRNPDLVIEHPGEATIPTSIVVCADGGMVVICAGTTGYSAVVDLRYHWVRQKRLQGSHGSNDEQARAYNDLVREHAIQPALGEVRGFDDIGALHQEMGEGALPPGNATVIVGASEPGLGSALRSAAA